MNKLETVKVAELVPYVRNSRIHDDAQIQKIAASIKEFGFTNPILIDEENGILSGHGRLLAARELGIDEVPCVRIIGLSNAQKRAYIIADNRLALSSTWDSEMLAMELGELSGLDFDLSVLGFTYSELEALLDIGDTDAEVGACMKADAVEVDTNFTFEHTCPRCGFEYN